MKSQKLTNSEADRLIDEYFKPNPGYLGTWVTDSELIEGTINNPSSLLGDVSDEHTKMFTSFSTRIKLEDIPKGAISELKERGWQIPTLNDSSLKEYQNLVFKPKEPLYKRILRKLFKL